MDDPMDRRCQLRTLNEMITCKICHGYLIDATTVTECLHTFCKSCIVKHLEDSNVCPECENMIHQSHPLDYIAFDRTMQDLVYKIVPDLEVDEFKRERKFYSERGLPCPKDQALEQESEEKRAAEAEAAMTPDANTNMDFHRFDEQVNLLLECKQIDEENGNETNNKNSDKNHSKKEIDENGQNKHNSVKNPPMLKRKFLRCSSLATVTHLKKFIAKKLLSSLDRYKDVDIMCNDEPLYKDHTLKFVYVTRWRTKEPPMRLHYIPKETASEVDDNSDDLKGSGGTKGDEKLIDSKSFNTLKESNLHKLPSSKLGQTTPTNMHRSVV